MKIAQITIETRKQPLGLDALSPRISWISQSDATGVNQQAYRVRVATDEQMTALVWDTGRVESDQSVLLPYAGKPLASRTLYHVNVQVWLDNGETASAQTTFETAFLHWTDWQAQWITPEYDFQAPKTACPIIRREFTLTGPVRRARVYVTAKGVYELRLNGEKVGEDFLTPGWTSYNHRTLYQTYDVTSQVRQGANAIGATIGSGWYKGELGWRSRRNLYGGREALILELHVDYEDGTSDVILTDANWKSSYRGPVLFAEIYHGETYDARLEQPWDLPGFDDSAWFGVRIMGRVSREVLHAQEGASVRVMERLRPQRIFTTPQGDLVLDMGQNMTGWVEFRVRGEAGERVVLSHAEILDPAGNFYTDNLKGAKQRIEYVLAGGEAVFRPHFTYQGFRYVRLDSFPGTPSLDDFTGLVLYTGMESIGEFTCSDPLLRQLQHNILWGQKGNFLDIPTDCPQRCERLGWTADIQLFSGTAAMNMDIDMFLTKWLRDVKAEQFPNGGVPWVVPDIYDDTYAYDLAGYVGQSDKVAAVWGDAAVICPWNLYLAYGDKRILLEQFDSMRRYVDFIRSQGDNPYLWDTGHQLGDWVALDAPYGSFVGATDVAYVATAYYAKSCQIVSEAARVLGMDEESMAYAELYERIVDAFRKKYIEEDGSLRVKTQTAIILAVWFDLAPKCYHAKLVDELAAWLERTNYDLITGFVGTPYILHTLAENGHVDAAYRLLLKKEYPSWLYQVTRGATTVWEHLDGLKPDGTLWNPRMNSFNHYAYGAVGEWLYRGIAGLRLCPDAPGYRRFQIRPCFGGGLTSASFALKSPYGDILSAWKKDGAALTLDIRVPVGTSAEVILPPIAEDAQALCAQSEGVRDAQATDQGCTLRLGSGVYQLRCTLRG